jgi:hypothetical protein
MLRRKNLDLKSIFPPQTMNIGSYLERADSKKAKNVQFRLKTTFGMQQFSPAHGC